MAARKRRPGNRRNGHDAEKGQGGVSNSSRKLERACSASPRPRIDRRPEASPKIQANRRSCGGEGQGEGAAKRGTLRNGLGRRITAPRRKNSKFLTGQGQGKGAAKRRTLRNELGRRIIAAKWENK